MTTHTFSQKRGIPRPSSGHISRPRLGKGAPMDSLAGSPVSAARSGRGRGRFGEERSGTGT